MRIKVKGAPRNHRRMSAMTRASFRSTKLHAASRDVTMPIVTDRHGHLRPSRPDATPPLAYTTRNGCARRPHSVPAAIGCVREQNNCEANVFKEWAGEVSSMWV
jgi:hypothetical protein